MFDLLNDSVERNGRSPKKMNGGLPDPIFGIQVPLAQKQLLVHGRGYVCYWVRLRSPVDRSPAAAARDFLTEHDGR